MPKTKLTPLERFLSKVKICQDTQCWEWQAYCMPDGYGRFGLNGRCILAHRASWHLHHGPVPKGMDVLHKCDNRPCVNPDHLFLGDDFINQQDRVAKGRHKGVAWEQRGECNKRAKLTEKAVIAIRSTYSGKRGEQQILARRYAVSQGLISLIVTRKVWTHI